jgi:predicted Holliday junction resolvase-like endonuclease
MGNPIDYIVFDWHRDTETNLTEGMVVFAEVKSAGSSLSTKQRRIRDLVRAGRVEWREVRLE